MLVQSWLQVPYTEHSSKSARKKNQGHGHLQGDESREVCALRHCHCLALQLCWRTTWQNITTIHVQTYPASPDLEKAT